jgi:hypothetical protein
MGVCTDRALAFHLQRKKNFPLRAGETPLRRDASAVCDFIAAFRGAARSTTLDSPSDEASRRAEDRTQLNNQKETHAFHIDSKGFELQFRIACSESIFPPSSGKLKLPEKYLRGPLQRIRFFCLWRRPEKSNPENTRKREGTPVSPFVSPSVFTYQKRKLSLVVHRTSSFKVLVIFY